MKNLTEQLSSYAAYHRDHRNIRTHFVGIPMIVFAVVILLSRPVLGAIGGELLITPAFFGGVFVNIFLRFGDCFPL